MASVFNVRGLRLRTNELFPVLSCYLSTAPEAVAVKDVSKQNELSIRTVRYPDIVPKFPPGAWGDMNREHAWQWEALSRRLRSIPSVRQRQDALLSKQALAMLKEHHREHRVHNFDEKIKELTTEAATVFKLAPFSDHPAALEFRKYATKTHIFDFNKEVPAVYNSLNTTVFNDAVQNLKKSIADHFLLDFDLAGHKNSSPEELSTRFCKSLIRCIADSLLSELNGKVKHIHNVAYDEDVIVRALWSRHGFKRKKMIYTYDPDKPKYDTVLDQPFSSEGRFDAMLRFHLPLPELLNISDSHVFSLSLPELKYPLVAYGEAKPGKEIPACILAGHKLGDPCEYGLLGFLSTVSSLETEKTYGSRVGQDSRLAYGLTNTFTWLVAQAMNQGFNHVLDLTYPLSSQTVLTDGKKFSFLAYQLNTMELWKDNQGNDKMNFCWHAQEMPLYNRIENGKVRDLNEDVLKMLVRMFMLEPSVRSHDMLEPSIQKSEPQEESLAQKEDFVPDVVVVEKVVQEEKYIVE